MLRNSSTVREWPQTPPEPIFAAVQTMGVVMSESRAAAPFRNRRLQRRYNLAPDAGATMKFCYPAPAGPFYDLRLRDISLSGLSMVVPNEFPEMQAGDMIKGIEVRVCRKAFRGDL